MTEYHTTYKGIDGETTQWDDIQRKLGNFIPKEPKYKPEKFAPEPEAVQGKDLVDSKAADELSDLEDDFQDDRFMEEYRQKRLQELRSVKQRPRFGTVEEIRASEFVQKVTNASSEGVCIVVHLYKDSHAPSGLMSICMEELATKYPNTKFVRIVSTDCIPKYPDNNLPTLLLYRDNQCQQHLVGLQTFGGQRMTPEQVGLTLNKYGPFCHAGSEEDVEAEAEAQVKSLVQRMLAQKVEGSAADAEDASSDFDD